LTDEEDAAHGVALPARGAHHLVDRCAFGSPQHLKPNRARASLSASTQNPAVSVFDSRQAPTNPACCHVHVAAAAAA
jgi:hypothetical protein